MAKKTITEKEARNFLDRCLVSNNIAATSHAKKQMKERQFDMDDAIYVIRYGEIIQVAWDSEYENHKVEIEGEDLDGEGLALLLALEIRESLTIVITGFAPRYW